MKTRIVIGVASLCLIGAILAVYFIPTRTTAAALAAPPVEIREVNYGNGVYYFPWTGNEYGRRLAEFRSKNPNLELIGATGEVGMSFGGMVGMVGYYVYFREK